MYIGIDFGTSEVKAVLMNENGAVIGHHGCPLTISRPQPMWSEQDPQAWWAACQKVLLQLKASAPNEYAKVQSIGLSGQMHGAVLLDAQNNVLRPAILWNDTRSYLECDELTSRVPNIHQISGNLVMSGFTAPKLLWVARHEPDIFAKTRRVLLPKDYIRYLLTHQFMSDMSDASGTLWLDVEKRDWSDVLLQACEMDRTWMPKLVEGNQISATLTLEIAERLGLSPSVTVAGGGGDNAASAVGIGAVQSGDGFISLGTSGVLFVVNDQFKPNPQQAVHAFCHALPNRWHQMSVMLSAASNLSWICRTVGKTELQLLDEIAQLQNPEQSPIFLPYLSGERTPHNDPHAQGLMFGLHHDTSPAHLGYAVIEGVAFGLLDGLYALQSTGTQVTELSLVGGGSKSPYWAQLIANILQTTIHTHQGAEASGALGAARLAAMADGISESDICFKPKIATSHHFENVFNYNRYARYQNLYKNTKALMQTGI